MRTTLALDDDLVACRGDAHLHGHRYIVQEMQSVAQFQEF